MDTDKPIYEYEDTPSLVARTLIISRFPAFEKHILEAFRNSSSFRELCEDYQSVFVCLNEMSLPDNMAKSFDEKYLKEVLETALSALEHARKIQGNDYLGTITSLKGAVNLVNILNTIENRN